MKHQLTNHISEDIPESVKEYLLSKLIPGTRFEFTSKKAAIIFAKIGLGFSWYDNDGNTEGYVFGKNKLTTIRFVE